ncbi:alpha/beta-hydrolase [Penicillium chermesinum]|uniref:Alpha/beta-hydrolase n=1 Tax=Penicillium chermesinum TaxID=63820 RepID=A0A9W9PJT9_9EURO|nr:alpha/beta-hydrolase [Penicillium chermesinum]KAJ5247271.1 alpha/beta-hydrolase [Penicillium chermesinum]
MSCEACRTIPPVVPTGYTANGRYLDIAGIKTWFVDDPADVTGPETASVGILGVYDAFGLASQTLQGADRLASQLDALVLVPDFFRGDAAQPAWFSLDPEERSRVLTKFMGGTAALPQNSEVLIAIMAASKARFTAVQTWGAYGLCWGGKVGRDVRTHVNILRLEKVDAERLTIPHIVLASKDEPADVVKEYSQIISGNGIGGHVETYSSMWHGWMGARAQLEDEHGCAEYIRGCVLSEFPPIQLNSPGQPRS